MGKELDYIYILKALQEIPFGVGKKLIIDFLQGEEKNQSIKKNKLFNKENFGALAYEESELGEMIDSLLINNMIQQVSISSNKFWKVMELTDKGRSEIDNPTLYKKKVAYQFKETKTEITDADRELFDSFKDFLGDYNDDQKKGITSNKEKILCIAGAGSGKTTVLTKRIEFMIKYKSVDPAKILAITFTRKARQEMMNRLESEGIFIAVETFNSFCEKILRKHNDLVYGKPMQVITYRDKIIMIKNALAAQNLQMFNAINQYFTAHQRRSKTDEQLANIFMNDCFFIRDLFKFKGKQLTESDFETDDVAHEQAAKIVHGVCNYIEAYMNKHGLRDFADQLIDTLDLFTKRKDLIPEYDHVLIDEYQDVNSTQIKLVDFLQPKNLFCVGDPRQSIYGWRGSDIKYILNFQEKYPDSEEITLTMNYRSRKSIVTLINSSIKTMGLPELKAQDGYDKDIKLIKFDSEPTEFEFVTQAIIKSELPRKEIFVLARTNRQLNELSLAMRQMSVDHVVRSDELRGTVQATDNQVTLATIHAIKGLEAELVFIIGCSGNNFPCKGSEHPVIEMVKVDEYDKEEEERRLFYVAMSRSKKSLYMSYSGKSPTHFITNDMMTIIEDGREQAKKKKLTLWDSSQAVERLKEWRKSIAEDLGVPAFMILHDKTITDICVMMPMTVEDLSNVHGLGPTKIQKYGDDILREINGV